MSETRDVVIKLNHNTYAADIRSLAETRQRKSKLDRESRACDVVIKNLRSLLFIAMKGASVARCGDVILTVKPEKRNPGKLTLRDGRSIPLSDIVEIVINQGSDVIRAADVETWFGGSVTGADIEITSTGNG